MKDHSGIAIKSREQARGPWHVERFKTLAEASAYIKDRWQGDEYRDGEDCFHTDYCEYVLRGFTFRDIGAFRFTDPTDKGLARFEFKDFEQAKPREYWEQGWKQKDKKLESERR